MGITNSSSLSFSQFSSPLATVWMRGGRGEGEGEASSSLYLLCVPNGQRKGKYFHSIDVSSSTRNCLHSHTRWIREEERDNETFPFHPSISHLLNCWAGQKLSGYREVSEWVTFSSRKGTQWWVLNEWPHSTAQFRFVLTEYAAYEIVWAPL